MAKITATTYTKPVPAEKDNPFVEVLKPFAEKGIDTPFAVEFTADEYKAEKLLIQRAANAHGFSAREVETNWDDELSGKSPVKSVFLIRPQRKPRNSGQADSGAEAEASAE